MDYKFHINDFDGPLDLLLHLVKQSKMDIETINTKEIIDQYLEFLNSMEELNINVASEYLVVASSLIHLKSKMLLNISDEEEESDEYTITSEEDLKNKLKEYEKYKLITASFKELEDKRKEVFTKLPESLKEYTTSNIQNGLFSTDDLLNALKELYNRQELAKPINTKITHKELSVEERTKDIRKILKEKKRVNFLDLFTEYTNEYIIVTFLSILVMSKDNELTITQETNFSPIYLERKI